MSDPFGIHDYFCLCMKGRDEGSIQQPLNFSSISTHTDRSQTYRKIYDIKVALTRRRNGVRRKYGIFAICTLDKMIGKGLEFQFTRRALLTSIQRKRIGVEYRALAGFTSHRGSPQISTQKLKQIPESVKMPHWYTSRQYFQPQHTKIKLQRKNEAITDPLPMPPNIPSHMVSSREIEEFPLSVAFCRFAAIIASA